MNFLSISENILLFIAGFGTVQGVLLALLLYFHPKADQSVNIFLALYIISLSIGSMIPLVERIVSWQKSFFIEPFPLLTGPMLYLYIRSFKERITWHKALPHVSLFFLFFLLSYEFFDYMGGKYPNAKEVPAKALHDPYAIFLGSIRILQLVLYYILSLRIWNFYQRSIQQLFSDTSRIDLHWMKWLINGLLFLVIASVIMYGLMLKYPEYFGLLLMIEVAILTPYIYLATFKGVTQPTLWQVQSGIDKETLEEEMQEAEAIEEERNSSERSRTAKKGLNKERIHQIAAKILFLMEEEGLYQETELTLQELADKLRLPTYQVSQAINEGLNKNFYDLINYYRVEEAKRLLIDPRNSNYTILSVGFGAGFNSKTTFNTVFKKFTGITPTEFRNREMAQPMSA